MNDEQIRSLWNKSTQGEPKMNVNAINRILDKSVRGGWFGLRVNVWTFLAMLAGAEIFNVLNLAGSVSHPGWLAAHAGLTVVTLGFFILGLRVLRELRTLADPDENVAGLVRKQLRFFHTTFEWWLWAWALTVWIVSFCIPVWLENRRGGYRIDHVIEFVAVSAGLIFGSYALFRLGHLPMVQRSLAALHDLEFQITEQTERIEARRKYWMIGAVLLVVALTVVVVWTIKVWLSATP
jgi:hypothetical protein